MSKYEWLRPERFVRRPLYEGLVAPSISQEESLADPCYHPIKFALRFAMLCGSPSLARQTLMNELYALYNGFPQRRDELGCTDSQYCNMVSVLETFITANALSSRTDLEHLKPSRGTPGKHDVLKYYPEKYVSYADLLRLTNDYNEQGKKIGLVQGFFDPVHLGHTTLFGEAYPFCDVLMVGVSKDTHVRSKGAGRPRYPLAARIAEITVSPAVGHTFVLPVGAINDEEGYRRVWSELGIDVVVCGEEQPILDIFQERMRVVNISNKRHGQIIPVERKYKDFSSSNLQIAFDNTPWDQPGHFAFHGWLLSDQQRLLAQEARAAGILWDYPNGT